MNHKNARIKKLLAKKLSIEQIVKKLGLNGEAGIERVKQGIEWLKKNG